MNNSHDVYYHRRNAARAWLDARRLSAADRRFIQEARERAKRLKAGAQ